MAKELIDALSEIQRAEGMYVLCTMVFVRALCS